MKRAILLVGTFSLAATAGLSAQITPADGDVVDRLVAVVGDSVVVRSQVEEQIARMELEGMSVPSRTDPAYREFFNGVLDGLVNRVLVLQAAARDSLIEVDDQLLDDRVQSRIDLLAQQFGGQAALQQALAAEGLTLAAYRDMMRSEARMEQLQQLYFQLRLRNAPPVEVTEDEMLARFQQARNQLQQRPRTLTFRQVVVRAQASDSAVAAARREAEALLERVQAGEDFAELAREHSDDRGSAELGGDLGWFRRGRMVREFEDAAFALFDGQVSPVVQTDFGFHVIKVERYRAGERQARHILVMPEKTEEDVQRARTLAEEIAAAARSGQALSALSAEHEAMVDGEAPDSLTIPFDQLAELPDAYGTALRAASGGTVVGPIEFDTGDEETRFAVVEVVEVREAGAYTFEDLRGQLASMLQEEKQRQRILEDLRTRTHIEVRR